MASSSADARLSLKGTQIWKGISANNFKNCPTFQFRNSVRRNSNAVFKLKMASTLSLWHLASPPTKWRTQFSEQRTTFGAVVVCRSSNHSATVPIWVHPSSQSSFLWTRSATQCICAGANFPKMLHSAMARPAKCLLRANNSRPFRRYPSRERQNRKLRRSDSF